MRVKVRDNIIEVNKVWVREDVIEVKNHLYRTGDKTKEIEKQLLEKGYADLSSFKRDYE